VEGAIQAKKGELVFSDIEHVKGEVRTLLVKSIIGDNRDVSREKEDGL
jgi:tRNA G37 N-methylase Trm5